ncbi:MAG: HNH endonuclease [Patescibacteria group bacterium]
MSTKTFTEIFWRNVNKRGPDDCWEWTGAKNKKGYGLFRYTPRNGLAGTLAHRFVYEIEREPIPFGEFFILHRCNNPGCVNPAHLFMANHEERVRHMSLTGRRARGERHGLSKFTAEQVIEIRALYAAGGISQRELADRHGVCQKTIGEIINGKTWKNVGGLK